MITSDKNLLKKNINKRVNILKGSCTRLISLAHVCVMVNNDIYLDLKQLTPSWDYDRRPEMRGGKIEYIKPSSLSVITTLKEYVSFNRLTIDEIGQINNYLNLMVTLPIKQEVMYIKDFKNKAENS